MSQQRRSRKRNAKVTPGQASAAAPAEGQLTCGKCGTALPPGSRFCLQCGAPVRVKAEARQETPVKAESAQQAASSAEVPQRPGQAEGAQPLAAVNIDEVMVYVWAGLLGLVCLISLVAFLRAVQ